MGYKIQCLMCSKKFKIHVVELVDIKDKDGNIIGKECSCPCCKNNTKVY